MEKCHFQSGKVRGLILTPKSSSLLLSFTSCSRHIPEVLIGSVLYNTQQANISGTVPEYWIVLNIEMHSLCIEMSNKMNGYYIIEILYVGLIR